MKIAIVALNPAIDQTIWLDDFRPGALNRGKTARSDPGGKGVNVASFLSDYLHDPTIGSTSQVAITGFFGEENSAIFERLFASKGIHDYAIRIPGLTRTSFKIVDESRQQTTDLNLPGLCPSPESLEQLYHTVLELSRDHPWFVLTGSLPPGVPQDLYARLIDTLHQRGCQVVLDTSGQALREGLRARPEILKPNRSELQELQNTPLTSLKEIRQAARALTPAHAGLVVVSLGKQGALFVDANSALLAVPPQVQIQSTVGAGDALVAGLVSALLDGLDAAGSARRAIAFSLAVITRAERGLPEAGAIQALAAQVRIRPMKT